VADSLERLSRAAREAAVWGRTVGSMERRLMSLGFPLGWATATFAPFDILGDTLRGMRGIILDMFRRPEKIIAACERLLPIILDWCLNRPGAELQTPLVVIPLHKGADGFMSEEQFKTFYWPTLRGLIEGLVEEGCIPVLFAEGRYESRLDLITDVPTGKTVWLFDQTDMARAKVTIGKVACIQGNMPLSLLHAGTTEEVVTYTRKLIDVAGEGGGFILDTGAVAESGKSENLHAMIKTAKEYGVY
jgi:uroporphyrinogen-III decarboxylase